MKINNKYDVGQMVKFGPYTCIITGIRVAGKPLNILYEISYFNSIEAYITNAVYDFEIEDMKKEFGFKTKGE